ncbi:MAG: DUF1801 domain-containing protein [Bacteroidales bacterium]|nr:DUF1801 domain-containing protein [Bacteroidales bacterium]
MNKFQPVKFRNIDEFLDYLPDEEREIVVFLRQIILESLPECREKLAYNVPFYYKKSRICFIWPPSVPWGNVNIKGVQLGFCNGYLLKDEDGYLEKGNRKQVYWKEYNSIIQVDPDLLREFLFEALAIDGKV